MKKTYRYFLGLTISTLLIIFGITFFRNWEPTNNNYFAILPHYMIAPKTVDNFYAFLKKELVEEPQYIVLISPNHFGAGTKKIDSTNSVQDRICFGSNCVVAASFGEESFFHQKDTSPHPLFFSSTSGWQTDEHGIGGHFMYINKYFPKAKTIPLVIHPQQFDEIDRLTNYLKNYDFGGKVLFLSSVDFSHYVQEDFALLHDKTSRYTINNSTQKEEFKELEVDCPPCLFLIKNLAFQNHQQANLRHRDSSSSLFGFDENTSRLFIYFDEEGGKIAPNFSSNGATLSLWGDTIYDRKILETYHSVTGFTASMTKFKSPSRIGNHNLLNGIDVNIANLEGPIVTNRASCKLSNQNKIRFCFSSGLTQILDTIGIDAVTLANNHIYDQGEPGLSQTVNLLAKEGIDYIGSLPNQESFIREKSIRGQMLRFFSFDLTQYQQELNNYCEELSMYKNSSGINIVSVHRGFEYEAKPNTFQKNSAQKLINCGADAIIGTHPHVRQGNEFYQGKPIVYSLGNFIFDQWNKKETSNMPYALLDIQNDGKIYLVTGFLAP